MGQGGNNEQAQADETVPSGPAVPQFAQGRYRFQRLLGKGGMGVVWLARDERLETLVAVKILPDQVRLDPGALASLRRETSRSQKLSHPNIIRLHDLHEDDGGGAFITMEYVDGANLSALRCGQPGEVFTWEKLIPIVRQLGEALAYAHGEKVIHRDLKPSNLMVDAQGRLKLADFGIAAVVSDTVARTTGTTATSGTVAYMSPQQMQGETPCATDDIYALGATLYELLSGTPPFYRGEVVHQVLHKPAPPLRQRMTELGVAGKVPARVEEVIMACLAKEPAKRPQTAHEVMDRLGLPETSARRPTSKPANVKVLAWALTAVVVLAAGLAGLNWGRPSPPSVPQITAPAAVSSPAAELPAVEPGFQRIFNGKDLSGWEGDTNAWSVRDGVLIGRIPPEAPMPNTGFPVVFLRWGETNCSHFELRFSWQWPELGVSGLVSYRRLASRPLTGHGSYYLSLYPFGPDDSSVFGWPGAGNFGVGERILIPKSGPVSRHREFLRDYTAFDDLGDMRGWNESILTVQGPRMTCRINGKVVAELLDERWQERPAEDRLALGVNAGPAHQPGQTMRYKNIRLKRLPSAVPPVSATAPAKPPEKIVFSDDFESFDAGGRPAAWNAAFFATVNKDWGTIGIKQEGTNHFVHAETTNSFERSPIALLRTMPVSPDWRKLTVSIRLRVHAPTQQGRSGVFLTCYGAKSRELDGFAIRQAVTGWTNRSMTFSVPTDTERLQILAGLDNGPGSMDFDDLKITVVEEEPLAASTPATQSGKIVFSDNFERFDAEACPPPWQKAGIQANWRLGTLRLGQEGTNRFMHVESPNDNGVMMYAELGLDPDWKKVEVSLRLRVHRLEIKPLGFSYAGLNMAWKNKNQEVIKYGSIKQTITDWTNRSIVVPVPPEASVLAIGGGLSFATGSMDFDDLKITVLETAPATASRLLCDETFEAGIYDGIPNGWAKQVFLHFRERGGLVGLQREENNGFLRLSRNTVAEPVRAELELALPPGINSMRLTVRVRAKGLAAAGAPQGAAAVIIYHWIDADGNVLRGIANDAISLKGDCAWTAREAILTNIPPAAKRMQIRPQIYTPNGTFDVDDLRLEVLSTTAEPKPASALPAGK